MINALRLGNFKAFADTQYIPIRPLTLIFGANSSGKSSILHGLLMAHHAVETGELDTFRTTLGGDSVDLGGFLQYIHQRDKNRQVEWGVELDTAHMTGHVAELLTSVRFVQIVITIGFNNQDNGTVRERKPVVKTYEIFGDGDDTPLLQMSRDDDVLRLTHLSLDHSLIQNIIHAIVEMSTSTSKLTDTDYITLQTAVKTLIPEIAFPLETLFPSRLPRIEQTFGQGVQESFLISQNNRDGDLAQSIRFFLPRALDDLVSGLNDILKTLLHKVRYLGPFRSYPPRHLAFAQHYDLNWFAGGGYAWDVVRRDAQVRAKVNQWLSDSHRLQTPYELIVREMVSANQVGGFSQNGDIDRLFELVMRDRRSNTTVSHRDIGIGISQVLPVLVSAYASNDTIIAIEQPEIHLHPALQAELGDVFITSALGEQKNNFLIETHSEHLILRIMRRMRDTVKGTLPDGLPPVTPDDVAVLYVEPDLDGEAIEVRELELDYDGDLLTPWPGGFFEESFNERFS